MILVIESESLRKNLRESLRTSAEKINPIVFHVPHEEKKTRDISVGGINLYPTKI